MFNLTFLCPTYIIMTSRSNQYEATTYFRKIGRVRKVVAMMQISKKGNEYLQKNGLKTRNNLPCKAKLRFILYTCKYILMFLWRKIYSRRVDEMKKNTLCFEVMYWPIILHMCTYSRRRNLLYSSKRKSGALYNKRAPLYRVYISCNVILCHIFMRSH